MSSESAAEHLATHTPSQGEANQRAEGRPHLVVGHDRRPYSQRALAVATDLAAGLNAYLHVVHILDLDDYPIDPDMPGWEEHAAAVIAREKDQVSTALSGRLTDWTFAVDRGERVSRLTSVADECDALMIIVGTHGDGLGAALGHLLRGTSVSHGLIRRKHRPVLVVPSP